MPRKHPDAARIGGPGASHQNRKDPEKTKPRGQHPAARKSAHASGVSGGGGEPDRHHKHSTARKGGR
jgi:hypothetical protein